MSLPYFWDISQPYHIKIPSSKNKGADEMKTMDEIKPSMRLPLWLYFSFLYTHWTLQKCLHIFFYIFLPLMYIFVISK